MRNHSTVLTLLLVSLNLIWPWSCSFSLIQIMYHLFQQALYLTEDDLFVLWWIVPLRLYSRLTRYWPNSYLMNVVYSAKVPVLGQLGSVHVIPGGHIHWRITLAPAPSLGGWQVGHTWSRPSCAGLRRHRPRSARSPTHSDGQEVGKHCPLQQLDVEVNDLPHRLWEHTCHVSSCLQDVTKLGLGWK